MTTEPKAFDPGPQQHGDEPITVKLPADFLPWQPGDVILDVGRNLYIRARQCDVEDGWPWCSGVSYAPADGTGIGEGGTADRQVQRPVTLLVRDGKPIGGMLLDDQAEALRPKAPKLPPGTEGCAWCWLDIVPDGKGGWRLLSHDGGDPWHCNSQWSDSPKEGHRPGKAQNGGMVPLTDAELAARTTP